MAPLKEVPSNTVCRGCGKALATRRGRRLHERTVHGMHRGGKIEFHCKECPKSFPSSSSASRCGKKDRLKAKKLAQQSASQETTPTTPTQTTPRTRAPRNLIRPPSPSALTFFNAAHPSTAGPSTAPSTAGPATGPFTAGPFTAGPFAAGPSANVHPGGAYNPALYGLGQPNPFYDWMNSPTHNPAPHQMNPPANNSAPHQPNPRANNLAPHQPNPPANNPAPDETNNLADLNYHLDQFGHIKFN